MIVNSWGGDTTHESNTVIIPVVIMINPTATVLWFRNKIITLMILTVRFQLHSRYDNKTRLPPFDIL